uniref:RING-type domain-containing protein n=1 Tax=Panagrolaimus superbus TaxID=310955 RepID=A0A914YTZ9_9BILA
MKCHQRLQELYVQLSDEDSEDVARKTAITLIQEMELFCNFCGQRYGLNDESLQALRCSHIFHEKCLHEFLHERESPTCPKCSCKAILMENVSLGTSSASSNNENEATAQQQPSSSKEKKQAIIEPPQGGIQTCFLQASIVPNHLPPSTSEENSFTQSFQSDPAVTIHSAKPVILVHSPSQETSDDATSLKIRTTRPRIVPTGSATPVICRVNQFNDNHAIPSAVVTRQKSPLATIKGPKPPPPPRKPNCSSRIHAFPPLPPELLTGIGATPISQNSSSTNTIRPQGPGVTDV